MIILPAISEPDFDLKNAFPVFYWNHVALEMNRITHSLGGPQTGPTMSSRALGLLHVAMHDAFFAVLRKSTPAAHTPYLSILQPNPVIGLPPAAQGDYDALSGPLDEANAALTGAALAILDRLYKTRGAGISAVAHQTLSENLSRLIGGYGPHINTLSPGHRFGEFVANLIFARLAVKPGEPGADQGRYEPRSGRYYFRDEPSHPVRRDPIDPDRPDLGTKAVRTYHGPFYGKTVESFAVSNDDLHQIAPPPVGPDAPAQDTAKYLASLREVHALGGAPTLNSTTRGADGTVAALFWAYDGANLIGTPPRLYNQIVRTVIWQQAPSDPLVSGDHERFVRVFALCNAAMADAGKFAWREKFRYEFWRPLSGIREHDSNSGPGADPLAGSNPIDPDADPFWLALGAPETNTHRTTFKPPFPAYPSGHATFGAACFQMLRLFYQAAGTSTQECDEIKFSFVSDELDGISRHLDGPYDGSLPIEDQPGLVRTRLVRKFDSLKEAIWENAFSRIWLGVHWNFDAYDPDDLQGSNPCDVEYGDVYVPGMNRGPNFPVGGVPLGIGIANDIFGTGLIEPTRSAAVEATMEAALAGAEVEVKASNTSTTQAAQ